MSFGLNAVTVRIYQCHKRCRCFVFIYESLQLFGFVTIPDAARLGTIVSFSGFFARVFPQPPSTFGADVSDKLTVGKYARR